MKLTLVGTTICALLVCTVPVAASVQKDHPIVSVIDLIKRLKAKSEAQGKEEAISYMKFEKFCTDSMKTLNKAIAGEKEKISELTDEIAGLTKEENALSNHISELTSELSNLQAAARKARNDRNTENGLYNTADSDYADTISAIDQAITALEGAQTTTHTMLLAQRAVQTARALVSATATDDQLNMLDEFVAKPRHVSAPAPAFSYSPAPRPDLLVGGGLSGHVKEYAFKSDSVIELLKELKYKFETEKLESVKAETNAVNSYNLAKQANDAAQSAAEAAKTEARTTRGDTRSDKSTANNNLKSEQSDLRDDEATLDATTEACNVKKQEWDQRSNIRSGEIEAMAAAIKILAKATGVRTEAPSNPVPPPAPSTAAANAAAAQSGFIQQHAVSFLEVVDPKMKAVNLLRASARTTHSRALERLAQEISVHLTGPFDEVNNMIEKMIFRLMAEQTDEDNHKLWCDKELEKTNAQKDDKDAHIEDLTAKIGALKGTIGTLTDDITDADDMVADIVAHMKEATEIRQTGKRENMLAIKDSQQAQKALADAIAVLESFYKESGMIAKQPYEFVQAPVQLPASPDTWDSSYTGVTDPTTEGAAENGVLTVLKANVEKFSTMEGDTKANEAEDQKLYDDEMSKCEIDKAARTKESEVKTAERKRQVAKVDSMEKQKSGTNAELKAVKQYLVDLQPACVSGDATYGLRKAARQKEMDALRQAQVILRDAFAAGPAPGCGRVVPRTALRARASAVSGQGDQRALAVRGQGLVTSEHRQ